MHTILIIELLILLAVANGTPVAAKLLLRDRFASPLDGGLRFADGRPLLGPSKTLRGVVLAVIATSAVASLIGLGWKLGAVVSATAMAGDILSSFTKRRLGVASSDQAIGLDQIPESLLPLIAAASMQPLTALDIVVATGLFFAGEIALSRLLFRLHLRDRPY